MSNSKHYELTSVRKLSYKKYIALIHQADGYRGIWNTALVSIENFEEKYPELTKKYRTRYAVTTGEVLIELDEIIPF